MTLGDPLDLPLAYPIHVERGALSVLGAAVERWAPAHRYAIIADATVLAAYGERIVGGFPAVRTRCFPVAPGEQEKTRERWAQLTDAMLDWGAARDTTVVAVGGGVVGDLAGFVAATYMRGVPFVQVPTTLLAMVDASVGGKTGVDAPSGKNLVGAFHDPRAVLIDPDVLATLPDDVLRSGLAEMIKHGVVADRSYFELMVRDLESIRRDGAHAVALPQLVAGSVCIKAAVVAEDSREGGMRRILNFGHTIAHAVEREVQYDMLHGNAVAIGMVMEAEIAEHLGVAGVGVAEAIGDALNRASLPTKLPLDRGLTAESLLCATRGDKKSQGGAVRYALPRAIGEMESAGGAWSVEVPDPVVLAVLGKALQAR